MTEEMHMGMKCRLYKRNSMGISAFAREDQTDESLEQK